MELVQRSQTMTTALRYSKRVDRQLDRYQRLNTQLTVDRNIPCCDALEGDDDEVAAKGS